MRDALRLPGLVTLLRLPLALAFPWVARRPTWALTVMAVAAATDVLDGWIARTTHTETPTGAALDAVLDKIFVLVVASTLLLDGSLTVGEVLMLGVRDLGEAPLLVQRALHHQVFSHRTPAHNAVGKMATVLQFIALADVLAGTPRRFGWFAAAAIFGLAAAASYWLREAHVETT